MYFFVLHSHTHTHLSLSHTLSLLWFYVVMTVSKKVLRHSRYWDAPLKNINCTIRLILTAPNNASKQEHTASCIWTKTFQQWPIMISQSLSWFLNPYIGWERTAKKKKTFKIQNLMEFCRKIWRKQFIGDLEKVWPAVDSTTKKEIRKAYNIIWLQN